MESENKNILIHSGQNLRTFLTKKMLVLCNQLEYFLVEDDISVSLADVFSVINLKLLFIFGNSSEAFNVISLTILLTGGVVLNTQDKLTPRVKILAIPIPT